MFVINHRAVPRSRYPTTLGDAQRAVRYVRHYADPPQAHPQGPAEVPGCWGHCRKPAIPVQQYRRTAAVFLVGADPQPLAERELPALRSLRSLRRPPQAPSRGSRDSAKPAADTPPNPTFCWLLADLWELVFGIARFALTGRPGGPMMRPAERAECRTGERGPGQHDH